MDDLEYGWRRLFMAAIMEKLVEQNDPARVSDRLTAADDAVFARLFELEGVQGCEVERLALEETMQDLRLMRNDCFHFRV